MSPEISIVVPFYNVEPYIDQCLDSIRKQTFGDFEVLCVDDRGRDNSIEVVEKYVRLDSRFKLIRQDENRGPGAARNVGMRMAGGKYITFIDPDDWVEPDLLEKEHEAIVRHGVDSVWIRFRRYYEDDGRFEPAIVQAPAGLVKLDADIVTGNLGSGCDKLCSLPFLRRNGVEFDEGIFHEDLGYVFRLCCCAGTIYQIPDALYNYRQRKGSTSTNAYAGSGRMLDMLEGWRRSLAFLRERGMFEEKKEWLLRLYESHFGLYLFLRPCKLEGVARLRDFLREIDFPAAYEPTGAEVLKAVAGCGKVHCWNLVYFFFLALTRLHPNRSARERWKVWLRVKFRAK
ncbi:MAG: glycosyltransferase family 2 protein [Planctomycetaceae bacterium]|nr:glycosyltransferase family 2 protein [Planctomycetaceae bacterium]